MKSNTKTFKYLMITLLVVVVISNTPPAVFFVAPSYHYQTADGEFQYTEEPGKAMDYQVLQIRYQRYLDENAHLTKDTTLYRTFRLKPWQFWQWWEMLVRNERFRLPYLETGNNGSG